MAPGTPPILFFSRGRGRGHAMPDMAIAEELRSLVDRLDIRFVSYGTGAATFLKNGYEVIDLKLPSNPPFSEAVVSFVRLVDSLRPQLIIAHEEFGALVAAEAFRICSIFITDFFQDPGTLPMRALQYASDIIFLGDRGLFTEPPFLKGKVQYVGAAVRPFSWRRSDRTRARAELGLPAEGTVISCMPGSWTEEQAPIGELLAGAFELLQFPSKHLVWLAGRDYDAVSRRFAGYAEITVKMEDRQIDRLMAASDLAVTKVTRSTIRELSALGIPSISLSHSLNWPDDVVANNISSNSCLDARNLNAETLAAKITERLRDAAPRIPDWPDGISKAAGLIGHYVKKTGSTAR